MTIWRADRAVPLWFFATLYGALTVAYAWPVATAMSRVLPNDLGDPALNSWILWWNSQAVPFTERWWSAPIFYPVEGAFALSETLLSLSILTTPLQWLGASAVFAHNAAFLLSFPAAGLAMHLLVRYLTGRDDAALLAGLAFAFNPYRAAQIPHLQVEWTAWLPLCLLALHRYRDTGAVRHLAAAAVCWSLNGFTNGYFLVYFAVLAGLWMAYFLRSARQFVAVSAALAIGSLPLVPLLLGHAHYQSMFGLERDPLEILQYSADLSAIWASADRVWAHHWTLEPYPEGELYPGGVILAIALAGAAWGWWRRGQDQSRRRALLLSTATFLVIGTFVFQTSGGWPFSALGIRLSLRRAPLALALFGLLLAVLLVTDSRIRGAWQRRSPLFFYATGAVLMLLFSLGPVAHVFGRPFWSHAPYSWLMELPGGRTLRVPARFATMMILCLVIAGGLAWRQVTRAGSRLAAAALLGLLVVLDGWVSEFPFVSIPTSASFSGVSPETPVLELPLGDTFLETTAELRATEHGHPIVNGYSGYEPPHYAPLREALQTGDPSVFDALQQFGPLVVLVNRGRDAGGSYAEFVQSSPGARRLSLMPSGPVFAFPRTTRKAAPDEATELRIVGVIDRWRQNAAPAVTDGNLETRWGSDAPQFVGDTLQIIFHDLVVVTHLEMSLGKHTMNYPRRLRITAHAEQGPVLWEGSTAGAAVLGTVESPMAVPLRITLDQSVPAATLVLTIMENNPDHYWSVSELRAFGRRP